MSNLNLDDMSRPPASSGFSKFFADTFRLLDRFLSIPFVPFDTICGPSRFWLSAGRRLEEVIREADQEEETQRVGVVVQRCAVSQGHVNMWSHFLKIGSQHIVDKHGHVVERRRKILG